MAVLKSKGFFGAVFCCISAAFIIFAISVPAAKAQNQRVLACYWGTWSHYRWADGHFSAEHINPHLCTHLIYSFAGVHNDTLQIYSLDPWLDLDVGEKEPLAPPGLDDGGLNMIRKTVDLRKENPDLQILIAVGGWNQGSERYSRMVATSQSRRTFIDSVLIYLEKYDLDGIDMDWEYPALRGGRPEDKENFVLLLKELREALDSVARPPGRQRLLLTAAFGCGKYTIDAAYDVPEIAKYLDYFFLMTYDFKTFGYNPGQNLIGHHSALYPKPWEDSSNASLTTSWAVDYFLELGAPPHKVVLGMGVYGRTYLLRDPQTTDFYDPSNGPGIPGLYTGESGIIAYFEVLSSHPSFKTFGQYLAVAQSYIEFLKPDITWTHKFDTEYGVPYSHSDRNWIGYDNVYSILRKNDFMRSRNLAGMMVWSIEQDDCRMLCGGNVRCPFISTIKTVINS